MLYKQTNRCYVFNPLKGYIDKIAVNPKDLPPYTCFKNKPIFINHVDAMWGIKRGQLRFDQLKGLHRWLFKELGFEYKPFNRGKAFQWDLARIVYKRLEATTIERFERFPDVLILPEKDSIFFELMCYFD